MIEVDEEYDNHTARSNKGSNKNDKRLTGKKRPSRKEKVEKETWICCDKCEKWVAQSDDPELIDLSLYDEDNPNKQLYSCPVCRGKGRDGTRGPKRQRTSKNQTPSPPTATRRSYGRTDPSKLRSERAQNRRSLRETATELAQIRRTTRKSKEEHEQRSDREGDEEEDENENEAEENNEKGETGDEGEDDEGADGDESQDNEEN